MSLERNERLADEHAGQEEDRNVLIDAESGHCTKEEIQSRCGLKKTLKSMTEKVLFLNDKNTKEDKMKRMQPYCVALLVILFLIVVIVFSVCPVYDIFKYFGHAEE